MSESGDDCYFYYYSTCVKGDKCPFRHEPSALGCELTCNLWEKGKCFKKPCKFRHMVIEKDRRNIPCMWESQPSGCMKPYCQYLHTKPRNIPVSQPAIPPQNMPIGNTRFPNNASRGPGMRPQMFNNNHPRPAMPPNQQPYMGAPRPMQQRPMGYQGYMPHSQPHHPMMYQMHPSGQSHMAAAMAYNGMMMPSMMVNQQAANYLMGTTRPPNRDDFDDSTDDYTSSDYSDVSISDDERRSRRRETSRRKVQSPRQKREVRPRERDSNSDSRSSSRDYSDSKKSRESYNERKSSRRRHDSDRDKRKKESERTRSKTKRDNESKEISSSDPKKSESSNEKSKSETEDTKSDIKVKTLEEILREKALKNLHERTAQKKAAQLLADKNNKEKSDDSPEPILKSVISVSKGETTLSQKTNESRDSDDEVEFVREKKAQSPKKIILDIIDPDDAVSTADETIRKVEVSSEKPPENKEEKEKDSQEQKASILTNIKVKTFEEIMEEKRLRKAQLMKESSRENQEETKEKNPELEKVVPETKLSRKIRVVKKEEKKAKDSSSNKLVKRRVQTKPKAGNETTSETKEEKTPEKKKERPINIVIKSFDEIIKEKRQRQQEKTSQIATTASQDVLLTATSSTITTLKSFDEIIKEKRQRQQEKTSQMATTASQDILLTTTSSNTTTVKRPTIIRTKQINITHPRTFKTRKLKVIGANKKLAENILQNASNPQSPTSPTSPKKLESLPDSTSKNTPLPSGPVVAEPVENRDEDNSYNNADDSDDDDSWEHEELPAVPPETPTLEGPARVPGIPGDDSTVLVIPGNPGQPASTARSSISPTKRPRSSLEELFGVSCDDDEHLKTADQSDDETSSVSPTKKVKTDEQTTSNIDDLGSSNSKEDSFDLDLEEEIANLPYKTYDGNDTTLNEDDLLLELEEMINN